MGLFKAQLGEVKEIIFDFIQQPFDWKPHSRIKRHEDKSSFCLLKFRSITRFLGWTKATAQQQLICSGNNFYLILHIKECNMVQRQLSSWRVEPVNIDNLVQHSKGFTSFTDYCVNVELAWRDTE